MNIFFIDSSLQDYCLILNYFFVHEEMERKYHVSSETNRRSSLNSTGSEDRNQTTENNSEICLELKAVKVLPNK